METSLRAPSVLDEQPRRVAKQQKRTMEDSWKDGNNKDERYASATEFVRALGLNLEYRATAVLTATGVASHTRNPVQVAPLAPSQSANRVITVLLTVGKPVKHGFRPRSVARVQTERSAGLPCSPIVGRAVEIPPPVKHHVALGYGTVASTLEVIQSRRSPIRVFSVGRGELEHRAATGTALAVEIPAERRCSVDIARTVEDHWTVRVRAHVAA